MEKNRERIIAWDAFARETWQKYETDEKQYKKKDDWRSHADEALAGKKWKDDCDGLASTVLDLLARDGFDPSWLYRAMVSSERIDKIDHFIGIVSDGSGLLVVGDTFGPAYPIKQMKHRLLALSRVDGGIEWLPVDHEVFMKRAR